MNYNYLKKLYNHSPSVLKKIYSLIPWEIRMGAEYRKTYDFLKNSEGWSSKEWRHYQRSFLRKMMIYCYENVPYYKMQFDKNNIDIDCNDVFREFKKIPLLTRKKVVNNRDMLLSRKFKKRELYKASTGGTTGKPVTIFHDKNSYKREWAFKVYLWNKAVDYNPDSRKATFRGVSLNGGLYYENPIYNEIRFSPFKTDNKSLHRIVNKIIDYKPEYIHGYPSAIEQLAKYLSLAKIELEVKAVKLISENIYPYQKELISRVFNAPVYSFYGLTERCIIASMDSGLNYYYPHPAYGFTEIIDENGKNISEYNITGELVGTGFINQGMPLLRYRTGDFSYWIDNKNEGDWNFKPLGEIKGRWNQEYLMGANGEKISLTSLNMHSGVYENIKKMQFYQDQKGLVVIKIVKDVNFTTEDEFNIKDKIREKVGAGFELEVKYVDKISLTKSGKSKYLVQNIDYFTFIILIALKYFFA